MKWPTGLEAPDSAMADAALSLCIEASPPFLADHAVRTFAWGCLLAEVDGIRFDRETFYVASLLHDLGLTSTFEGPGCFEDRSADAALHFAQRHGSDRAETIAEAIRLHMRDRVTPEYGAEAYLLSEATSYDVSGRRFEEIDQANRELVLAMAPRAGFSGGFAELFRREAEAKPRCAAAVAVGAGLLDRIANAPLDIQGT